MNDYNAQTERGRIEREHLDEITALLFLEQQLNGDHEREVSEHAKSCAKCRSLVRVLRNEDVWLRQALTENDEAIPARLLAATPPRATAPWRWAGSAAALGLASAGAYTLWSGVVEPSVDQASQVGLTQWNVMTSLLFGSAFWNGWGDMIDGLELLGVATLTVVCLWLMRRRVRKSTRIGIAMVMSAMAFALLTPAGASAAELEHSDRTYILPAGQEVKNDLMVWADHAEIDGTVDGDLIVGAHEVEVNGHVKGDILGFTQNLRMNGTVDGNVRVFAAEAELNGSVEKNLMAFAQTIDQTEKSTIGGSATLVERDADLRGPINGDVLVLGRNLEIDGRVGGSATVRSENLTIGSSAQIAGKTQYVGPNQPQIASGAKLASPIEVTVRKTVRPRTTGNFLLSRTLRWGSAFVLGMLLFLLAPAFFKDVTETTKDVGISMGVGVIGLIVTPIAAAIACITIVGLGVGISALLTYAVGVYMAQVFVGQWLGERILGNDAAQGPMLLRLALGLAILHAIRLIPFVGLAVMTVVTVWGLGASTLTVHRRVQRQTVAA
jgi:cytoskeletal protein CcmA (bactofilin family)